MTAPVILVTGASRGLGRGMALELARGGFSVAINYAGNAAAAAESPYAQIIHTPRTRSSVPHVQLVCTNSPTQFLSKSKF